MLRQLTALEPPSLTNFTPQCPFVQSTSHLQIIIWGFSESERVFVENAPRVICCQNRCDSANVSLGECDLGAHDAPRVVAWSETGG